MADEDAPAEHDRGEPVGEPVVRGDPAITGDHADRAVRFDPGDPESLAEAVEVVREFADRSTGDEIYVLRGAAACATLVRGEGSYRGAAERAGVDVEFLRTWARVHDLPIAIRRHIAAGEIPASAAKHVARVTGDARYLLAWAILDGDLTVEEVRAVSSDVSNGASVEAALEERGVVPGRIQISLPPDLYREFRRATAHRDEDARTIVASALRDWLSE